MRSESKTMCAKCGHPMHWIGCFAAIPRDSGPDGECACRNDVSEFAALPDVTPKTASPEPPPLYEAVNDLLLLLPGSLDEDREINAAIGIVVASAGREAASKAVAEVLDRLEAGAKAIPAACHSHSGLNCEKDDYGWCYLIAREDVFALIASERPSEKETGSAP